MHNESLYHFSPSVHTWRAENQLPEWIYKNVAQKRLIFTITTGRSGTGYLATILNTLPNIVAQHEPEPKFSHWMRKVQTQPDIAVYFWLLKKLGAIARLDTPCYLETSHLFGKGFFEALELLGLPFDLIILKRNKRDVAKSLFQLNVIPGRTVDGLKFLVSPEDPVLVPLPAHQVLNDYQLCYWYTLEMEARGDYYAEQVRKRGGVVAEIAFEEIFTEDGIRKLLTKLNLPSVALSQLASYQSNRSKTINDKHEMKQRPFPFNAEELQAFEQEVLQLTQHYENEVHHGK